MARKRYYDEDVLNLLRQIELSLAAGAINSVITRRKILVALE